MNLSCGNLITYVFHNDKKVFGDCHVSIEEQKLCTKRNCQPLVSIRKAMKLTGAEKEMRNFINECGIIIIILDMLKLNLYFV